MLTMEQARALRAGKRLSGDRNQCACCGLLFNSSAAFDKHRSGTYGTGSGLPAVRRCLSQPEMVDIGMALNQAGFWVTHRLTAEGMEARDGAFQNDPEALGEGQQVLAQP